MARPLRIQYPEAVYHVTNRGLARQLIFLDASDRLAFLNVLADAWSRWRIELYAYCLMGNHYHLCLKTPEAKLSRIMRHINGVYTQQFNRAHRRDGPLFRGRYKALLIEAEDYLGQVVRYIHLNPVEAEMVKKPEDYKWSSHKDYVRRKAPRWLSTGRLMEWFGTRSEFQEFVLEGNEKTIREMYLRRRWPAILGSESFIDGIRKRAPEVSKEHVREERQFIRPSVQKILETVSREFKVPLREVIEGKRGETNEARKVALWALREYGDQTHQEIASVVGLGSWKTVSWACHEIRRFAGQDRALRKRLENIQRAISQPET